jgi:hypothetical protein
MGHFVYVSVFGSICVLIIARIIFVLVVLIAVISIFVISVFFIVVFMFVLCVPKGQHRVWILDMYMTGRFDLPYSIPSITNFTSDDAKWVYRNWRRCQLWHLTNMQVGSVWDSEGVLRVNSDTTRDLLRRAGEIITASQNRTHKMTYAEIQRGVGERFEQRIGELRSSSQYLEVGSGLTYWDGNKNGLVVLSQGYEAMAEAIAQSVGIDTARQAILKGGANKKMAEQPQYVLYVLEYERGFELIV